MKIKGIEAQFKEFLKNYLGALTTQGLNFKMLPTFASEDAGKSSRRWAQSGQRRLLLLLRPSAAAAARKWRRGRMEKQMVASKWLGDGGERWRSAGEEKAKETEKRKKQKQKGGEASPEKEESNFYLANFIFGPHNSRLPFFFNNSKNSQPHNNLHTSN